MMGISEFRIFLCHWIPLICHRKTRYLDQTFRSQKSKHWFSEDTFLALMRLRGVECAVRICRGVLLSQDDLRLNLLAVVAVSMLGKDRVSSLHISR